MHSQRPLSPRLSIYRWASGMLASIAHRGTGIILVLSVPFYLAFLHQLTGSPEDFSRLTHLLHSHLGQFGLWLISLVVFYHLCNGIRFLCLDAGWGESRAAMRRNSRLVLGATVIAGVLFGVWL